MTSNETHTASELPPETNDLAHHMFDAHITRKGNPKAAVDLPLTLTDLMTRFDEPKR